MSEEWAVSAGTPLEAAAMGRRTIFANGSRPGGAGRGEIPPGRDCTIAAGSDPGDPARYGTLDALRDHLDAPTLRVSTNLRASGKQSMSGSAQWTKYSGLEHLGIIVPERLVTHRVMCSRGRATWSASS